MDFKQFLAAKHALALVEHMETLSEQDAQQLFDTLDEETIEFIEAVLNEVPITALNRAENNLRLSPKERKKIQDLYAVDRENYVEPKKESGKSETRKPGQIDNQLRARLAHGGKLTEGLARTVRRLQRSGDSGALSAATSMLNRRSWIKTDPRGFSQSGMAAPVNASLLRTLHPGISKEERKKQETKHLTPENIAKMRERAPITFDARGDSPKDKRRFDLGVPETRTSEGTFDKFANKYGYSNRFVSAAIDRQQKAYEKTQKEKGKKN